MVVLAVTLAQRFYLAEVWIAFGTGKCFRFIAAHEIAKALGPDRCIALPMFHAFTGCDMVSFLEEKLKELHGIHVYDDVTPTLSVFFSDHPSVCGEFIKPLE